MSEPDAPSHPAVGPPEGQRSMGPVFGLTLLLILLSPLLYRNKIGTGAFTLGVAAIALMALNRSGVRRSVLVLARSVVVAMAVAATLSRVGDAAWLETAATALLALLLLVTPVIVVGRLLQRPRITLDTLSGALAAYLQFGLFFAALFRLVEEATGDPFFGQAASAMDFQFFSYVTLTTLGYGNLVPEGDLGMTLASLEAIIGQIFLVTVVALAVGNLGAEIPRRPQRGGAGSG